MFERARRRLALRYLALLVVVVVAFSGVFFAVLAVVLQPDFDVSQDASPEAVAERAYRRTIERIAIAIVLADGVVLLLVGGAAYYLAGRTLDPIREAHERQRRFVADASHEMRTPITAIRSTAESALATPEDPSAERAALETIVASAERLARLTSDLLSLARSERGLLVEHRTAIDLSVVTAEAVAAARAARGGATTVDLSLQPDLVVEADEREVEQIVVNLVDNAIRHGSGGRPVRVRTTTIDGQPVVEVADDGPGIAAADVEHIFEPFYRAQTGAGGGVGLGLAIAADGARRNGGRLTVESAPGAGATFRLQLPRARTG